ncbi:MAG TPA: glycosyltransferase [Gemmatimonadaceae bacterium]
MVPASTSRAPRVALVAGTLGQGGAEKQLLYLVRALLAMEAEVVVCSLTRGEYHESALRELGVEPRWIGRHANPAVRTVALAAALRDFGPHIVQSAHFYTNLYVSLVAPLYGAMSIGTARSDIVHEVAANGSWGRWLLRLPGSLLVNSYAAKRNAVKYGRDDEDVHVLPNVIDLAAFDEAAALEREADGDASRPVGGGSGEVTVVGVGTLVRAKRFDRFLRAMAMARSTGAPVRGMIVGDGPELASLEELARQLGLLDGGVSFVGRRGDIPRLLRGAHIYALTSEHEGFPNVVLEAMAAGLPVVATPAGDAAVVVEEDVTGYVVPHDDVEAMAAKLTALAASAELRGRLGTAGRRAVERRYAAEGFATRVAESYRAIALRRGHDRSLAVLPV